MRTSAKWLLTTTLALLPAYPAQGGREDDDDDPILVVFGPTGVENCTGYAHFNGDGEVLEGTYGNITKKRFTAVIGEACTYVTPDVYPMLQDWTIPWVRVEVLAGMLSYELSTAKTMVQDAAEANLDDRRVEALADTLANQWPWVTSCQQVSATNAPDRELQQYLNRYWASPVLGDNIPALKVMLGQSPNPAGAAFGAYTFQQKMNVTIDCIGSWEI